MQAEGHHQIETVLKALESLESKGESLAPLFEEIANHLYNLAEEAFENETSPDGTAWKPLKPLTIKSKGQGRKLHHSGHLRETLVADSNSQSATVGTSAASEGGYPYPAVHQLGSARVPARPFLPFTPEGDLMEGVTDGILELVGEWFEEST